MSEDRWRSGDDFVTVVTGLIFRYSCAKDRRDALRGDTIWSSNTDGSETIEALMKISVEGFGNFNVQQRREAVDRSVDRLCGQDHHPGGRVQDQETGDDD